MSTTRFSNRRGFASGVAVIALALLLGLAAGCGKTTETTTKGGGAVGTTAPAFALPDLEGHEVKDTDLRGKVVILDFWATWCGPCKIEIPWFIEFQQKYGQQGLQVVGVSIDDTLDKLKPYVSQMKMNYMVLQGLDQDAMQDAYGPMFGIPITVLISRDGKMCKKHVGLSSKEAFENEIKSLL
jgi:thiol-disulfide isomerase/thioredoxin